MSEYNEDELVAPEWLASEFLTEVLSSSEEVKASDITVQSYDVQPATKKGDHYASIMYRVTVKYLLNGEQLKKSLIIKIMPEVEGQKLELLGDTNIFETEIAMYSDVIPRFTQILREIGDDTVLGPGCLYYTLQPRKVIVFEDLVPLGYATLRTTTLEQAKCAYMKLAKWQAISYKINAETPEYFDKYRDGFMNMKNMVDNDFFQCGITHFVELLDTIPTLRKYKPYFERIHDTLLDDCKTSFNEYRNNPQADAYYVLCHGDFHSRNIMLKTNAKTGDWEDIMLLDFQMCFVGSIALDFIYSIYLIIDSDLRPSHIDELLYFYLTVFNDTLDKIGFEGEKLKIRALREQIFRHRKWELFLLTTFLPVWDGYRDGTLDAVKLLSSKEFTRTVYKNEKFVKELHTLLPYLERLGYFEE